MYYTAKEYHIAFDERYQQLNLARKRTLTPEQIDFKLNEAVIQFINTRSNKKTNLKREGFEETAKRYDDLKDLKEYSIPFPVYKFDDTTVFSYLPKDYLHLIKSISSVVYNCNGVSYTTTPTTRVLAIADFPDDTGTTSMYATFKLILNGTTIFDIADYTGFPTLNNKESKFEIIKLVIQEVNRLYSNLECYWEQYGSLYYPNCFLLIDKLIVPSTFVVTYTGYVPTAHTFTTISLNQEVTTLTSTSRQNDLVSEAEDDKMIDNFYYNKNRQNRPISILRSNLLLIKHTDKFIIKDVIFSYIKKPRLININLGTTCELPHIEEIVGMAVQSALADINSPTYKSVATENQIKE